jgi:NAD(P) transhydrogenase subunit alpha
MSAGSVIVDCAAERGGNCELTDPNVEVLTENSVTILGPTNLASAVPHEASLMYAKNTVAFLLHLVREGELAIDLEDDIIAGTLVTRDGKIVNPRVLGSLEVGRVPGT